MFTVNTASILSAIAKLSVEDQVALVQRIWDNIATSATPLRLTEAQRAELDRRLAELDANPNLAIPWEDVKRAVEERPKG
jgi:putative addiction module component (TIGR02574 family)